MATTSDVSVGVFVRFNNELCQITEWMHRTPGNLRAFYQAKIKNLTLSVYSPTDGPLPYSPN